MNITFMIGNGFDLNIGLKTRYKDFILDYLKVDTKDDMLKKFKQDIDRNADLWSSAELAFGQYTNEFSHEKNEVEAFTNCHENFCVNLAEYLKKQEKRINYGVLKDNLATDFIQCMKNIMGGFRTEQRDTIRRSVDAVGGGFQYNFISFNYTRTLDKCVEYAKAEVEVLGRRTYNGHIYANTIGELIHVHGYTDRDMVLGVNDETQIVNMKLFENEYPEYLAQIIKKETNQMNGEYVDRRVYELLEKSNLIYIYVMSIGETDAIWWKRICDLLSQKQNLRIILHCFDAPQESLFRTKHIAYERKMRERLIRFSEFDEEKNNEISQRIHIATNNIFNEIKDICTGKIEEQGLKAM